MGDLKTEKEMNNNLPTKVPPSLWRDRSSFEFMFPDSKSKCIFFFLMTIKMWLSSVYSVLILVFLCYAGDNFASHSVWYISKVEPIGFSNWLEVDVKERVKDDSKFFDL